MAGNRGAPRRGMCWTFHGMCWTVLFFSFFSLLPQFGVLWSAMPSSPPSHPESQASPKPKATS